MAEAYLRQSPLAHLNLLGRAVAHRGDAGIALCERATTAQVALRVMRNTDHVLLVGAGALRFARLHGFEEENLLTDRARRAWLRWKEGLSTKDDWVAPREGRKREKRPPRPTGTIHRWSSERTPALRKRRWESFTRPPPSRSTWIRGKPGCSMKEAMAAVSPLPEEASGDGQRSSPVALPQACSSR